MENKYDNPEFFSKYRQMARSQKGLAAAGEWHVLQKMLPDFNGKRVLDLGCGMGWHCLYAAEHGAEAVTGIDSSEKMLTEARVKTREQHMGNIVDYRQMPREEIDFPDDTFDIVWSSLAFHYIESFENICVKVKK